VTQTPWIATPDALRARLQAWQGQPLVALDTEFMRERTWYPQLALVQMAIPGEAILVDPLAPGVPEVLRGWLEDASVTKLMHSASEDLQALQRGCGALPAPLFDTQVAAAIAGFGAGLGYQKLVEQVTGVVLPKGETRSDWLRRPLSPAQCEYAADDVLYLHRIHAALAEALTAKGRTAWAEADAARMLANARHDEPEAHPHLALRSAQFLDAEAQQRLWRMLRWREGIAREHDKPKNWILDAELAATLARRPPPDVHALGRLLDAHPRSPRQLRGELWAVLTAPLDDEARAIPLAQAQDDAGKRQLKALQAAVAGVAEAHGLPEGTLASRRHLEALMAGPGWPVALEGWRRTLLEGALAPLLAR
jgi:ribonuclease D